MHTNVGQKSWIARGAPKYVLDAVFTGQLDEVVVLAAGPLHPPNNSFLAARRAQEQQLLRLELHANLLPPTTRLQRNGAATHTGGAVAAAPNNARVVHRFAVAPVLEPRGLKKIIIALLARSYHDNGTAQQSRRVAVAQRWKELRRPWPIVHGRCKRLDGYRSLSGMRSEAGYWMSCGR